MLAHCGTHAEDAKTAQTFFETAYDYAKKGNYAVAVEMYRKGLQYAPKGQDGHFFLAEALEQMGEHEKEAIAEYTIARDLNPTSEHGVRAAAKILAFRQMMAMPPQQRELPDCDICPDMIVIPSGTFQMGSPASEAGRSDYEGPIHAVTIAKPFALGKYAVTRGQFRRFAEETARIPGSCDHWNGKEWKPSPKWTWNTLWFEQDDAHPVVCVNWEDARAYADWLSRKTGKKYRLPSEAEWEYAARAGTATSRYWGDDPSQACAYANAADLDAKQNQPSWTDVHQCHDGWMGTAPVGRYRPNAFGLYDMLGNAWQWTEDCWNDNYNGAPTDGRARTTGNCSLRVLRGGSWSFEPRLVRSARRGWGSAEARGFMAGFRLVKTLP